MRFLLDIACNPSAPKAALAVKAVLVTLLLAGPWFPPGLRAAPRLEATWSQPSVRPGKAALLTVTARWEGDPNGYAVGPPSAEFPSGVQAGPVSSQSYRQGEENVIRFSLAVTASEPGLIPAFPLRLDVLQAGAREPMQEEVRTEPLRVEEARWGGFPRWAVLAAAVPACLVLAGGTAWALRTRRKRAGARAHPVKAPGERSSALSSLAEELSACRVRGDTLAFLETALRVCRQAAPGDEAPETEEIQERLEQARYGGVHLSGEEMDAHLRRLKRLLKPAAET